MLISLKGMWFVYYMVCGSYIHIYSGTYTLNEFEIWNVNQLNELLFSIWRWYPATYLDILIWTQSYFNEMDVFEHGCAHSAIPNTKPIFRKSSNHNAIIGNDCIQFTNPQIRFIIVIVNTSNVSRSKSVDFHVRLTLKPAARIWFVFHWICRFAFENEFILLML